MKKFLYAAAVALAFCAAQARAEGFQVDSVRVGPASDHGVASHSLRQRKHNPVPG